DPLGHGLLLFVDSDVRVLGCKAAQGRLAALHLLPRLVELAPEELLGRDVVGAARLFVGLQVRLGVCRREKGRQGGVRGREPHLRNAATCMPTKVAAPFASRSLSPRRSTLPSRRSWMGDWRATSRRVDAV